MPNEEHVKILRQGAKVWNRWRKKNPDITPDLSVARLNGYELENLNLKNSNLSHIGLEGGKLNKCAMKGSYLRKAHLQGIKVIKSDISFVRLDGADIRNSEFKGSTLRWSSLVAAHLANSTFKNCDLTGVKLYNSILKNSILHDVGLEVADLSYVDLSYSNLKNSYFGRTVFYNTFLKGAKFLSTCRHYTDSIVDPYTYLVSGSLSKGFLKKCGYSDWEIEAFKLYDENIKSNTFLDLVYKMYEMRNNFPIKYYSCFISYSIDDEDFATQLYDALNKNGIRVWLDKHQMLPGDDIYEQIERGIKLWDKIILCCSKSSLTSWWVDNEIDTAFEKERKIMKERGEKVLNIIPLNLDGYMFTDKWKSGKKRQLLSRVAADFTNWQNNKAIFNKKIKDVIKTLKVDDIGREKPPKSLL